MMVSELKEKWSGCLEFIRDNVTPSIFNTWFAEIKPLKLEDGELTIQVPSAFVYEYLEDNYLNIIRAAITKAIGKGTKLMYSVLTDKSNDFSVELSSTNSTLSQFKDTVKADNKSPEIIDTPQVQDLDSMLNPNYGFDNFIEGYSNKLARTAGETVASNPANSSFNPLFIYGSSGVGKTHLVNAIGLKVKRSEERRVGKECRSRWSPYH